VVSDNAGDVLTAITAGSQGVYSTIPSTMPTFRPSSVPTIIVPSLSLTPSARPTYKPSAAPSARPTTARPSTTLRPTVSQDLVWNQLPSSALVNSTSHFTGVASDSTGQHLALINKNDFLISSDFGIALCMFQWLSLIMTSKLQAPAGFVQIRPHTILISTISLKVTTGLPWR
jgi:hypothetical protein